MMIRRWFSTLASSSSLLLLLLPTVLFSEAGLAKKAVDGPRISSTKVDREPNGLFYFEDSDTVVYQDFGHTGGFFDPVDKGSVFISFDAGETWDVVKAEDGTTVRDKAVYVTAHPYDKNKAYVMGGDGTHWMTKDQGKTWTTFEIEVFPTSIDFHGGDSRKVLVQGTACANFFQCIDRTYYTTNDFETVKHLRDEVRSCAWAVGTAEFAELSDAAKEVEDRVLCIVPGLKDSLDTANRLVASDDFFADDAEGSEVNLQDGRPVSGIVNMAAVKKYLVVAAKSRGTDELALYVTDDTKVWHRAEFGDHRLEQDAFTILESTNYSIQVDVLTSPEAGMGVLFTSNSNGTYFTRNIEHTNRNEMGLVDFEKMANIQGIVMVNTVANAEDIEKGQADRKMVVSKISFDDGRTFQPLKAGDKNLNLYSVTALKNTGRVFSSPAPGLVMGVGNTGDHLKNYADGDLYVSDDAGLTWRHARDGPHMYEFGDQGAVLVAVSDKGKTDKISYSIDHGKTWEQAELKHKIYPTLLTTTPDSTSLKFLLTGSTKERGGDHIIYSIDFSGLHERKCEKDDFEKWPARLDENGEPDCLMGHKQFYRRRKANADCFVDEEFKDPSPIFDQCKCTAEDFECDYNFVRSEDGKSCEPAVPLTPPEGKCRDPKDTYKGPSGWRLIPGNACERKGGENLDKEIERSCSDTAGGGGGGGGPVRDGAISAKKQYFDAKRFGDYYYLERQATSKGDDETIVLRTEDMEVFVTHDHGKTWEQVLKGEKITQIIPHQYNNDMAIFLTDGKKAFATVNRADSITAFDLPLPRTRERLPALSFHAKHKDWLIWTGATDCGRSKCPSEAHISKRRGDKWDLLLRAVGKCEFGYREDRKDSENLVFCEQHESEKPDNPLQLLSSRNWFDDSEVHVSNIIDFATMAEFVVVASRDETKQDSLRASASVDGKVFAPAEFPPNLEVPVQTAYTVLDSSTHAVFLHVTVNSEEGREYGSLIKSNSNGTSYVLSLNAVNRNSRGYVDFEKMKGLEGVAIANVVGNVAKVKSGEAKRLKTAITHNDGAQWSFLAPPAKDAEGNKYPCSVKNNEPTEKCSLHLHGYTERRDPRNTYASGSAIGLMLGTGNVGEYLTEREDADTFMTRDGGITWKSVKKGEYLWEYGDSGSVIVLVAKSRRTKTLYYSFDEGDTWKEYEFSDVEMQIDDISTVPSDTSKNFLLWGKDLSGEGERKLATVNVDFSGLRDRSCRLDEGKGESEDYYLWEPKHPMQENGCLFGHVEQYQRKKPEAVCWNDWREPHVHSIGKNCTCTRSDYECDYNFEPQSDGSCGLVPGLPKPDHMAYCRENPDAIEYWEVTGYRRIPLTTCEGGRLLDQQTSHPCPNKEKEYEEKHGVSGWVVFLAVVIPVGIACAAGYYVYTRWDGKFGQIRLGENVGSSGGAEGIFSFSRDSPLIAVPVAIIAGVVAVAQALPLLATSLWRSASGYMRLGRSGGRGGSYQRPYSSRAAFTSRRGDYTSVVDDEDELLGADDGELDEEDEV